MNQNQNNFSWTPRVIRPGKFSKEMLAYWTTELNNEYNQKLVDSWQILCKTFNDQTRKFGFQTATKTDKDGQEVSYKIPGKIRVVPMQTGTGKTQGLMLYVAMLCAHRTPERFPGALIITRKIEDAEYIAATISKLAKKYNPKIKQNVAFAHHSEQEDVPPVELCNYPVLVITHRSYEMSLQFQTRGDEYPAMWLCRERFRPYLNWHYFNSNIKGDTNLYREKQILELPRRKLVVIDECISLVQAYSMTWKDANFVYGRCLDAQRKFPEEVEAIKTYKDVLDRIHNQEQNSIDKGFPERTERLLAWYPKRLEWTQHKDMDTIKQLVNKREKIILGYVSPSRLSKLQQEVIKSVPERDIKRLKDMFSALKAFMNGFVYYSKLNYKETIHTAKKLLPRNFNGAVILDATATINAVYLLIPDNILEIVDVPSSRSYTRVNLYLSEGHMMGKRTMLKKAEGDVESFLQMIQDDERFDDKRILVVTHKKMREFFDVQLEQYKSVKFSKKRFAVTNWRRVEGSNEWRDFDTIFVFGLPYLPKSWAINNFFALAGVRTTNWLNMPLFRRNDKYFDKTDPLDALREGQMAADIVQAINRVRCRKVIDGHGRCDPVDIYLPVKSIDAQFDFLNKVYCTMKGIKLHQKKWSFEMARKDPFLGKYGPTLLVYLQNWDVDAEGREKRASIIRHELCDENKKPIPTATWNRLVASIKDDSTPLSKAVKKLKVKIARKRNRLYFRKSSAET